MEHIPEQPEKQIEPMTLARYGEIKARLDDAKADEMSARLELLARSGHTAKGSKTVVLDGFKVAFTNTVNVNVFLPGIEAARKELGEEVFASVFVPKYDFSQSGFNKLTDEQKEAAEEAMTSSKGTPQIKIGKPVVEEGADD